jgi:1-phosphatidylinositol-3-phosphate 5-kinase
MSLFLYSLFAQVPDRWMKQKDQAEEDPNSLLELWPDW